MIIKNLIEIRNKEIIKKLDEHNKSISLRKGEEIRAEALNYGNSLIVGRCYFFPSEQYRQNYDKIFTKSFNS